MQIQIEWNDNEALFVDSKGRDFFVVCDTCKEPIRKADDGVVSWLVTGELPEQVTFRFYHKSTQVCDSGTGSSETLERVLDGIKDSLERE